ncbi:MAG: alpha/beta hydrolase-fold protein, partial [Marinilabilia sp.]
MNSKIILAGVLFCFFAFWADNSSAQYYKTGPQVGNFYSEIDDSEQSYALYLPENFEPEKTYPLVVMLHGAMSNHRLALRRVFGKTNLPGESDAEASRYFPEWDNEEYIVVAPYARGTMGYVGIPEEDVMQVIEKTRKDFNIDRNRIYLTGLSMGGGGTLFIGLSRPDLFAAIAPVCPAPPP